MILRSGLKYEYSCNEFHKNVFFRHLKVDIRDINELDIIFINDFCNIIVRLNGSNQIEVTAFFLSHLLLLLLLLPL